MNIQHVAIIMDGNRRWATEWGLPKLMGHTEGAKRVREITKAAVEFGIPYLTLYALSTENLKERTEKEVKHLLSLIEKLTEYLSDFLENDVKLNVIGDLEALPTSTQTVLNNMMEKTKHHKKLTLSLAINYGGRDEIVRAVKKMMEEKISPKTITEEKIQQYLDTKDTPDVDLVIRTAGDQRLSNYLPWQTVYAELYFTKTKWPAFKKPDFEKAIEWFEEQKRNRGK